MWTQYFLFTNSNDGNNGKFIAFFQFQLNVESIKFMDWTNNVIRQLENKEEEEREKKY